MIENLQHELYQLQNNQAKDAKLCANVRWELECEKWSKTFFKILERQNLQNQTISELYTDDNKLKYSSNPTDILKSAKKNYEKLYTKETTSKAAPTEFKSKIPNRRKIFNEQFNLCDFKISLDEIIICINFQTNNNFLGNDGLKAELYKHFSDKLAPVILDVHDSWSKFGTMGVTSRTRIYLSCIKRW